MPDRVRRQPSVLLGVLLLIFLYRLQKPRSVVSMSTGISSQGVLFSNKDAEYRQEFKTPEAVEGFRLAACKLLNVLFKFDVANSTTLSSWDPRCTHS